MLEYIRSSRIQATVEDYHLPTVEICDVITVVDYHIVTVKGCDHGRLNIY
jgi:hypothetical protein